MFDYGNANDAQIEAISTTDGPVLIIAGPGTGKTFTLVQRTVYLIQVCHVKPEQILLATFTDKAANELVTRITNELAERDISVNMNEMYIGTFHSLCLRIIKDHLEYSTIKKNYRLLDTFDQQYTVFQHIDDFREIENFDKVFRERSAWEQAGEICEYVNNLSEELVSPEQLLKDDDPAIVALGNIMVIYQHILIDNNLIDFSTMQTECYRILTKNPAILQELQKQIRYLMIDEYQDTNYIQERLVFLLGEKCKNICVVGDDDQGLYRFRGATIRNILEFPEQFKKGQCKIVQLVKNYRSNSDIINFYNNWMETTHGRDFAFCWDRFRYNKRIEPQEVSKINSPAVLKLSGYDDEDAWHENILQFIYELKNSGKITDYNQIAFLFSSVRNERAQNLARYLEMNGINIYSPRSNMFFQRYEIRLLLGCLMFIFANYVDKLKNNQHGFLPLEDYAYYLGCLKDTENFIMLPENKPLFSFLSNYKDKISKLEKNTDYTYSDLIYQLFEFKPFSDCLDVDLHSNAVDVRPTRDLAIFTQIIRKFENLYRVDVLKGSKYNDGERDVDKTTEILFNLYLRLHIDEGVTEHEDDSEYAPSGCISFMTIHQSKGMEFPIVFVDSLGKNPQKSYKLLMVEVERKYFHRGAFEPYDDIKYFDFWRLYYTAFSRPQDLLILTCNETKRSPSKYFENAYNKLPSIDNPSFHLEDFTFHTVKNTNLKKTYSFTSDIAVYDTCALQYKFYKELEFMPALQGAKIFGIVVHETIEDIHRAVLRNEKEDITEENITKWFNNNYQSIVESEHYYLSKPLREVALQQVLRYANQQSETWNAVKQAEVNVTLVQPDYIIGGKVDLLKGEGDTVELVDFKAEKKPDKEQMKGRIKLYCEQLQLYAYLIEKTTGQHVSKMHLYYTAEESGNPFVSVPYNRNAIDKTVATFDDTVHKIMRKEYTHYAESSKTCDNCDFRFYCKINKHI